MEAVKNELNEFQAKALLEAESQLEKKQKEYYAKKYLIDISKEDIKALSTFIEKDAKWKFTECLGIVEVNKELSSCVKSGKLFTTAVCIEAIYYYMSKVEGTGETTEATNSLSKLNDYLRILKAIISGVERIKADGEELRAFEFTVAARREGIEPDSVASDEKSQ